jgi:ketosteroid isomerase-like protein
MKSNETQLTVRMTSSQKLWLYKHAQAQRRSVNGELLALIDAAMRAENELKKVHPDIKTAVGAPLEAR